MKGCCAFPRESTAEFCAFVEANNIKPVIAQTFKFEETVEAFETLRKQSAVGKIVVEIGEE